MKIKKSPSYWTPASHLGMSRLLRQQAPQLLGRLSKVNQPKMKKTSLKAAVKFAKMPPPPDLGISTKPLEGTSPPAGTALPKFDMAPMSAKPILNTTLPPTPKMPEAKTNLPKPPKPHLAKAVRLPPLQ